MADQIGNQLIAELSRRVVIEVAPEEHQAFNAISEAYFKNPKKTLKGKRGEDELIGFGIEEIALPLTPIILEVTKETLHHHLKSVTSNRSPTLLERLKELLERLKKSVKRFFGAQFIPLMPLDLLLPLDEEQRKFIHQRVHDRAVQLGVNANKVSLIADSVVANLQVHPLPSLGVPTVDEALDWAWLVDLGQGNFATAYQAAEAALRQGRSVDTLFAWAVVNQLQGNYTEALPAFHEAFIATQDGERKTIVAAMAYLAQRQREGLLPDKVSVLFLELQDWFPRDAAAFTSKQFFESVEQAHVPEVMMAGFFILYILVNAPSNWSSFANFQDNAESKSRYLEYLQSFQAYWQQLTPDILSPAVAVAHAWILAVHQKTDALGWLDQFIVQQEQLVQTLTPKESQKHQPSLGWLWLQRGDLLATSDQLGHPLMFGFRITSSGGDTTVPVNPDLFNFSNLDLPGARIAYQGASQYFAAAEMLRGMAMVESRWGYLDAREGNWEGAEQRYLSACQQFETLGDSIHALAARAGCIWTQIQRNQPQQEILDAAKAWAEVVKSRDALVFGIGYGLAFAYVGRQALATQGDIELALTCDSFALNLVG
jgi:tetratricopeptide (TPR) repeat protein